MIRRFNFTGRSRLALKSITLEVKAGTPPTLSLRCSETGSIAGDGVRGEVRLKETGGLRHMRVPLKRGEGLWTLEDHLLHGLDPSSTRVKVLFIDEGASGRIRASSTEMELPEIGGGAQQGRPASILPVQYVNELDGRAWRVAFEPEVDIPTLQVFDGIPNVRDLVRRDPVFRLLVLPAAVEQVLMEIFGAEESADLPDDDDASAESRWLRWSLRVLGGREPPDGSREERKDWVRQVVSAFSGNARLVGDALTHWEDE